MYVTRLLVLCKSQRVHWKDGHSAMLRAVYRFLDWFVMRTNAGMILKTQTNLYDTSETQKNPHLISYHFPDLDITFQMEQYNLYLPKIMKKEWINLWIYKSVHPSILLTSVFHELITLIAPSLKRLLNKFL